MKKHLLIVAVGHGTAHACHYPTSPTATPTGPDISAFPMVYEVDYVRVYQNK